MKRIAAPSWLRLPRSSYRKELESGNLPLAPGQSVASILGDVQSSLAHARRPTRSCGSGSPPPHELTTRARTLGHTSTTSQGSKNTLQYKAHAYPTKVPPEVIVRLLLHYTEPGDVVLDGFAGSGMTGVAAQMCATPDTAIDAGVQEAWADAAMGSTSGRTQRPCSECDVPGQRRDASRRP